jgi:dipeptidyl aminopeptidase/acylaminoacyl peptidase
MGGPRLHVRPRSVRFTLAVLGIMYFGYQSSQPLVRSRLEWFDRSGNQVAALGELADYGNVELSPDGKQVAVTLMDPRERTHDIWFYDISSGRRTQFTDTPADENWLIWAPDGQKVVFNRFSFGRSELYLASADGSGTEETLLSDEDGVWPVSWSPDGRFILIVKNSDGTGNDIWVLPLFGDRRASPIFRTQYAENWASFSPNGKWIAFSSTFSGAPVVYISPFPTNGQVLRVSDESGTQARWRRDGKEIFYLDPEKNLMAVPINDGGPDVDVGSARLLFKTNYPYPPYHAFDAGTDGERFLVNTLILAPGRPTNIAD